MAKNPKVIAGGIDRELLATIVAATEANSFVYASKTAFQPMISHEPPLVEVNDTMIDPSDPTRYATRATANAAVYLTAPVAAEAPVAAAGAYAIISDAILPDPKKRGAAFGSGAPTKYPFADMGVGASFFSPDADHAKGDAVKGLGSTVSAQNKKYSEGIVGDDGQPKMKVVTRAVRGDDHKAKLDGNGKKITETVALPVLKYNRKFTIRPVIAGQKYGNWLAPANGALIQRTL